MVWLVRSLCAIHLTGIPLSPFYQTKVLHKSGALPLSATTTRAKPFLLAGRQRQYSVVFKSRNQFFQPVCETFHILVKNVFLAPKTCTTVIMSNTSCYSMLLWWCRIQVLLFGIDGLKTTFVSGIVIQNYFVSSSHQYLLQNGLVFLYLEPFPCLKIAKIVEIVEICMVS